MSYDYFCICIIFLVCPASKFFGPSPLILDHLLFTGEFGIFLIFKITTNFGIYRAQNIHVPKSASRGTLHLLLRSAVPPGSELFY
jgi:hypothetical protein